MKISKPTRDAGGQNATWRRRLACATLAAIAVLISAGRSPGGQDKNLISSDGGFEEPPRPQGDDQLSGGWLRFPIDGITQARFSLSRDAVHGGEAAQCIEVTRLMNGVPRLSLPLPGGIERGNSYELAAWVRSQKRNATLTLCVHDSKHWFPRNHARADRPIGQEWSHIAMVFTAGETDPHAHLGLALSEENAVWIDDVSFRLISDPTPPEAGSHQGRRANKLRNASFEVGQAAWTVCDALLTVREDRDAPHGERVAVVTGHGIPNARIESDGFFLKPGVPCTLSVHIRGRQPHARASIGICMGDRAIATRECEPPVGRWERVTVSVRAECHPDETAYVSIIPPPDGEVEIDAIQLEEGDEATTFRPRHGVESALSLVGHTGGPAWYVPGVSVAATLAAYNDCERTERSMRCRVVDLWERVVPGSTTDFSWDMPHGYSSRRLEVLSEAGATGAFRMECCADAQAGGLPYAECLFSVFPRSSGTLASPLGITLDYNPSRTAAYRNAGFGWNKTWLLDWTRMQPTPASPLRVSRFQDERLHDWRSSGFRTLGILSEAPAWARERETDWGWSAPRDIDAMRRYAATVVSRVGDGVGIWELQNEPNQELHARKNESRATGYAAEAAALAAGAREARSDVKLLLGSLTVRDEFGNFFDEIFAAQPSLAARDPTTGRPHLHGVSFHFYTADPAILRRTMADIRGSLDRHGLDRLAVWDTEWAPFDNCRSMKCEERRSATRSSPTPRRAAALVVQGFVARLGEGVEAAILYDTYNPGSMGQASHKTMLELDGSFTPVATAVAVLATELEGATGYEPLNWPQAWAYRVRRSGRRPVTIAWRKDTTPAAVPIELTNVVPSEFRDVMGNILMLDASDTGVMLPDEPVYILEKIEK